MKVSICVPIYNMESGLKLLKRNLSSVMNQSYQDFEIIISDDSQDDKFEKWFIEHPYIPVKYFRNEGAKGMANNTNNSIDKAQGEIVKILFQDDYLYSRNSLKDLIKHFTPTTVWTASACIHTWDGVNLLNPHYAFYSESENTIGSPSVVAFRNWITTRFDPKLVWVLDIDFYRKLNKSYGRPKIINSINVVIGWHNGQATHKIPDQVKLNEHKQLNIKS